MVNRLLDILRPKPTDYSASTPLFTVTAKEFESQATQKEKWYGTRYQVSRGVGLVLRLGLGLWWGFDLGLDADVHGHR